MGLIPTKCRQTLINFRLLQLGVKSFEQVKHFSLAGVDIPCEENIKLLGVELDFMFNFDKQIKKNMCMKAAPQLNVLQSLSKFLSAKPKHLIFKSFIQSNFNYNCPLVHMAFLWQGKYREIRKTPIQSSQDCF